MDEADSSQDEDDESEKDDEDDEMMQMNFDDEANPKQNQKDKTKGKQAKGIMGLKFMQLAQEKEKQALKNQANLLSKQIKGEDDYEESDENAEQSNDENMISGKDKFGIKPLKEPKKKIIDEKPLDNDTVIKAARAVTGNMEDDSDSDESDSPKHAP